MAFCIGVVLGAIFQALDGMRENSSYVSYLMGLLCAFTTVVVIMLIQG